MTALDFYKNRLKNRGFSEKQIKDLTDHKDLPWIQFAEDYHAEQLRLNQSSLQLKDKHPITLNKWAKDNGYKYSFTDVYIKGGAWFNTKQMWQKYNEAMKNL